MAMVVSFIMLKDTTMKMTLTFNLSTCTKMTRSNMTSHCRILTVFLLSTFLIGCNKPDGGRKAPIKVDYSRIEYFELTTLERERQIELIGDIDSGKRIGRNINDFVELFSLADATKYKNGEVYCYRFDRTGSGGNDDGTDRGCWMWVEGECISDYDVDDVVCY